MPNTTSTAIRPDAAAPSAIRSRPADASAGACECPCACVVVVVAHDMNDERRRLGYVHSPGHITFTVPRVLMGLLFYPRGGSAHVARNLATALPRAGWDATILTGSVSAARTSRRRRGASTAASTSAPWT